MRPSGFTLPLAAALLVAAPFASAQDAAPRGAPSAEKPTPAPKAAPARAPAPSPAKARPAAPSGPGARTAPARDGIEALETRLDAAADRVSAPQLLPMLGRPTGARGYRLPGYGVVVVLAPRALGGADVLKVVRPRHRVRVETRTPGPEWVEAPAELEAIEHQVILLQHESERARRAAEETQERIVETVRWRLSSPDGSPGQMTVEVSPAEPPEVPRPAEAPAAPEAPAGVPEAPAPAEAPAPPPPPPPPWKYWFSAEGPRDTRSPDAVVADVRAALVDALASHPGRVVGLGPDEFVTVAVDFEDASRLARRPRPERTLVVRARVRDIEARAAGAIAPEELRRRLEVLEY
jgi:hypothetical protein